MAIFARFSDVIMARKPYFHTFDLFSEQPEDGSSYYARYIQLPKSRPSLFGKIIVKLHLQAFWQKLKMKKC